MQGRLKWQFKSSSFTSEHDMLRVMKCSHWVSRKRWLHESRFCLPPVTRWVDSHNLPIETSKGVQLKQVYRCQNSSPNQNNNQKPIWEKIRYFNFNSVRLQPDNEDEVDLRIRNGNDSGTSGTDRSKQDSSPRDEITYIYYTLNSIQFLISSFQTTGAPPATSCTPSRTSRRGTPPCFWGCRDADSVLRSPCDVPWILLKVIFLPTKDI